MLGKIEPKEVQNENGMVVVSECVDYVTLAHKNTESVECRNRAEYCFMFFDPLYQNAEGYNVFQYLAQSPRTDEYGMKLLEAISKDGTDIDFSTVTSCYSTIEEMTSSYAKQVSFKTNGINIEDISPEIIVNESIKHIYSKVPDDNRLYEILIGTSYTVVNLKKPITEKYLENAIKYGHRYIEDISEFDEEDLIDCADTDEDGLWDFQEIKVFKGSNETPENQIIWFEDGKLMLPTVNDMTKEVYKDIYSIEEIDAFREYFAEQYGHNIDSEFWNTPILPINSHPTELDGDGDGIPDIGDHYPLKFEDKDFSKHSMLLNENGFYFCEFCDLEVMSPCLQDEYILTEEDYYNVRTLCGFNMFLLNNRINNVKGFSNTETYEKLLLLEVDNIRRKSEYNNKYDMVDEKGDCITYIKDPSDISPYLYCNYGVEVADASNYFKYEYLFDDTISDVILSIGGVAFPALGTLSTLLGIGLSFDDGIKEGLGECSYAAAMEIISRYLGNPLGSEVSLLTDLIKIKTEQDNDDTVVEFGDRFANVSIWIKCKYNHDTNDHRCPGAFQAYYGYFWYKDTQLVYMRGDYVVQY